MFLLDVIWITVVYKFLNKEKIKKEYIIYNNNNKKDNKNTNSAVIIKIIKI